MAELNIILHEPEIPANTGNIGRTCVATGSSYRAFRFFIVRESVKKGWNGLLEGS